MLIFLDVIAASPSQLIITDILIFLDVIAGFHQVCARGGAGGQDEAEGDPIRLLPDHGVAVQHAEPR